MSTGTRAGSAAIARRAKEEIVRVLFGSKVLGGEAHSYPKLRAAYLGRVQEIHPDKHKHNESTLSAESAKQQFNELQEAWNAYEKVVKTLSQTSNDVKVEADFTLFGVGCSFSDSETERALRNEITDQACRGWFSSGALSAANSADSAGETPTLKVPVSLVDDDMFISIDDATCGDPLDVDRRAKTSSRPLVGNLKKPKK